MAVVRKGDITTKKTEEREQEGSLSSNLGKRWADIVSSFKKGMAGGLEGPKQGFNIAGSIGGAINDVAGAVAEPVIKKVQQGMEKVAQKGIEKGIVPEQTTGVEKLAMQAMQKGGQIWEDFKKNNPAAARGVENVANIAGAGPVVRAGTTAVKTAVSAAAKSAVSTGNVSKALGESVMSTVIPPINDVEAKALQNYLAKNTLPQRIKAAVKGVDLGKPDTAARRAVETGAFGTESMIGVQANRVAGKLKSIIDPILDKTKASVYRSEIVRDLRSFVDGINDVGMQERFSEALKIISSELDKYSEYIGLKKAQNIKSEITKPQPASVFSRGKKGLDITNEYKSLKLMMADSIKRQTYDRLGPEAKDLYKAWSKALDLMELGIKDLKGKPVYGANFWGRLIDKTVVPIGTTGGQILYSLGNMLQFKGRPGIKKFGDYVKDTFGEAQLLLEAPKNSLPKVIQGEAPGVMEGIKNIASSDIKQGATSILSQDDAIKYLSQFSPSIKEFSDKFIPEQAKKKLILDLRNRKEITAEMLNKAAAEIEKHNEMIRINKKKLVIPLKGKYPNALDLRKPKP